MSHLRRRFEEQFADCTYIGDSGAFYFDNIGAEDVKLFNLKQTYKLRKKVKDSVTRQGIQCQILVDLLLQQLTS